MGCFSQYQFLLQDIMDRTFILLFFFFLASTLIEGNVLFFLLQFILEIILCSFIKARIEKNTQTLLTSLPITSMSQYDLCKILHMQEPNWDVIWIQSKGHYLEGS